MIHLSPIDIGIILAYFGGVLFVGYRSTRRTGTSEEDFLLAGRSLTLPIFVIRLVGSDLRASGFCRTWPNRPPNRRFYG